MKKRVGLLICTPMLMGSESQGAPQILTNIANGIKDKASKVFNSKIGQNIKNNQFVRTLTTLTQEQILSQLPQHLRPMATNPNAIKAIIAMAGNPRNARIELDELMVKEPELAPQLRQLILTMART